jgi:hypothetical protein
MGSCAVWFNHFENGSNVLLYIEPAKDGGLLREVADAEASTLVHRQAGHVMAVELDLAAVGLDEAGDHVEDRGLAGAVGPQQADRLAAPHIQADAAHDLTTAEGLFDAVRRQKALREGALATVRPRLRPAQARPRLGRTRIRHPGPGVRRHRIGVGARATGP